MYAFMRTEKRVETKCDRVRKLSAYLHVGEDPGLLVETELGGGLDGDPGDGSVVVQEVTQQLLAGAHLQRGGGGGRQALSWEHLTWLLAHLELVIRDEL